VAESGEHTLAQVAEIVGLGTREGVRLRIERPALESLRDIDSLREVWDQQEDVIADRKPSMWDAVGPGLEYGDALSHARDGMRYLEAALDVCADAGKVKPSDLTSRCRISWTAADRALRHYAKRGMLTRVNRNEYAAPAAESECHQWKSANTSR
jgi:hypothetical protein